MSVTAVQQGTGFCQACYDFDRRTVLAVDAVSGSVCRTHLRNPEWIPPSKDAVLARHEQRRAEEEAAREAGVSAEQEAAARRRPRRRAWSALSVAGQAICSWHAAQPSDWTVPEQALARLGALRGLGVRTLDDSREVVGQFLACEATERWQRNRWWRTYAIVIVLSRLMDWEQESVVQATAEEIAKRATKLMLGFDMFGFAVDGHGQAAGLKQLRISRRSVNDAMAWMEEAGLVACLLRGVSKEALGAEHGRAGIWALTAPTIPEAPILTPTTCADAPPGRVSPSPCLTGPVLREAAQAPPQNGLGSSEIGFDFSLDAVGVLDEAPLTRGEQRLLEVFSNAETLPVREAPDPDVQNLAKKVSLRKGRADQAWDHRVPRSFEGRRKIASQIIRRAAWQHRITAARLAGVLNMWFEAGWCAAAVIHALDWKPDGSRQLRGFAGARDLAGVIGSRMAAWLDDQGRPVEAPVAAFARGQVAPSVLRAAATPAAATDTDAAEAAREAALSARDAERDRARAAERASDEVRTQRAAEIRALLSRGASRPVR